MIPVPRTAIVVLFSVTSYISLLGSAYIDERGTALALDRVVNYRPPVGSKHGTGDRKQRSSADLQLNHYLLQLFAFANKISLFLRPASYRPEQDKERVTGITG